MSEGRPYIAFEDGFVLTADSRQWITGIERVFQSGEQEGEEYVAEKRFHSTLSDAILSLTERRLRSRPVRELQRLLEEHRQLETEIRGALG